MLLLCCFYAFICTISSQYNWINRLFSTIPDIMALFEYSYNYSNINYGNSVSKLCQICVSILITIPPNENHYHLDYTLIPQPILFHANITN